MKQIPLTQDMVALVDDENYEGLMRYRWCYVKNPRKNTGYAARNKRKQECRRNGKRGLILMHKIILNTPSGYETDHINGNGLDNRKENLRVATRSQNKYNTSKHIDNTSGYKGVSRNKGTRKWEAYITFETKKKHLGLFTDKLEAAKAHNEAAIKYYGDFVCRR